MFGSFKEKYYPSGVLLYEGSYKNGKSNGYGKSYFPSGELQYEGMWADGNYHGEGTLYDENGSVVFSGEWLNGHQATHKHEKNKININYDKLDYYLSELDSLIGLMDVKRELNSLINFVKLQRIRKERGLDIPTISLHMVYTGNPGTGKTTVARLISQILYELGCLSKGHIIETNRAGLVAGYLGQTAIKTEEIVRRAVGGVLFIDEAYTLTNAADDYGQEAIVTLLKLMEDYRDDLVVIVAGYPKLMEKFIESNPGLASRFNKRIPFQDYSSEELMEIFDFMCMKNSYKIDTEAKEFLNTYIKELLNNKEEHFGNARAIRNIFEKSIMFQANRVVSMEEDNDKALSEEELILLKKVDIARSIDRKERSK